MTTHKPLSLLSLVLALAIIFSPHDSFAQDAEEALSVPHLGEMTMFAGMSFDLEGWARCDGKLYDPRFGRSDDLYTLLGKRFGGDGKNTFGVPNFTEATKAMRIDYLIATTGRYPYYGTAGVSKKTAQANKASNGLIGEIRLTPFTNLMNGWVYCDGRKLNIREHFKLFSVIGTTYGGDGKTTFAVPNLDKLTEKMKKMKEAIAAKKAEIKAAIAAKKYYRLLESELIELEKSYAVGRAVAGDQLGKGKLRYVICTAGGFPYRGRVTRKMTIDRERFLAEVMLFAGSYEPESWSFCDGRSMNIQLNQLLYAHVGGNNYHSFGNHDSPTPKKPNSFYLPNLWRAEAALAKAAGLLESESVIWRQNQDKAKGLRYLIRTNGYAPIRARETWEKEQRGRGRNGG